MSPYRWSIPRNTYEVVHPPHESQNHAEDRPRTAVLELADEITDFVISPAGSSIGDRGDHRGCLGVVQWLVAALSTILVVDDDRDTRSLLRLIFETAGHSVVEAPHGKAALDIIRPNSLPDVVVTDLRMPVLSGLHLIEHLHSEPRTRAIPIVVVSANSDAARTLQTSGLVQAVVRKPFDVHALIECIENVGISPAEKVRI